MVIDSFCCSDTDKESTTSYQIPFHNLPTSLPCRYPLFFYKLSSSNYIQASSTFYSVSIAPIMNFHFVPETVTQGQGDPLSIEVPLHPFMNFHFVPETVTHGQGDPLSIAVPLHPLWIFTHSLSVAVPLWIFIIVPETVTQGPGDPLSRGPTSPIYEFSLCRRNCGPKTMIPTFKKSNCVGPTAPFMNFHIVPETVTQGPGDPISRGPTAPIYELSHCPRNCDPRTRRPIFYSGPTAPILNFHIVAETVTQGPGSHLSIAVLLRPLWISLCRRNCNRGQGDPPSRGPFLRPFMNFHIVPETVTQGPGDPLSISVPLRPFMNFHFVAETVTKFLGDPPSRGSFLRPFWIFFWSRWCWHKDKETNWVGPLVLFGGYFTFFGTCWPPKMYLVTWEFCYFLPVGRLKTKDYI